MIPAILADFIFDVMIAENIADCAVRLNDDDAICNSCFSAAGCLRLHIWALMFHNSLLGHKSVFTPHNLNAHISLS